MVDDCAQNTEIINVVIFDWLIEYSTLLLIKLNSTYGLVYIYRHKNKNIILIFCRRHHRQYVRTDAADKRSTVTLV